MLGKNPSLCKTIITGSTPIMISNFLLNPGSYLHRLLEFLRRKDQSVHLNQLLIPGLIHLMALLKTHIFILPALKIVYLSKKEGKLPGLLFLPLLIPGV